MQKWVPGVWIQSSTITEPTVQELQLCLSFSRHSQPMLAQLHAENSSESRAVLKTWGGSLKKGTQRRGEQMRAEAGSVLLCSALVAKMSILSFTLSSWTHPSWSQLHQTCGCLRATPTFPVLLHRSYHILGISQIILTLFQLGKVKNQEAVDLP